MIKTIVAPATGNDRDTAVFEAALRTARQFDAHLDMLHVRPDVTELAIAMTADVGGATMLDGLVERLDADARAQEASAKRLFDAFCTREGLATKAVPAGQPAPSAQWHVEVGEEPRWLAAYAAAADISVAGRAGADDVAARARIEALLLDTGRPLLIPASGAGAARPLPAKPERVAIAWKPTPSAARAVTAAMPFLSAAVEIVVMTVVEDGATGDGGRLAANFAWHGLTARSLPLKPGAKGPADTLLAAASAQAELLVMGGYGHSRLREWIFGGFTQRVLEDAPIPVLMAH